MSTNEYATKMAAREYRERFIATAQDAWHYLASALGEDTHGNESTFGAAQTMWGRLHAYEHAREKLLECVDLAHNGDVTGRHDCVQDAPNFLDDMEDHKGLTNEAHLRTQALAALAHLEAWLTALHVDGYTGQEIK
jgi:hypothetical protein